MKFTVTDRLLREMFALSSFVVPEDELVFFALRGVQPIEFGGSDFRNSQEVLTVPIDYRHMRCAIGQWDTGKGKLAVFVGSSVPHISSVEAHLAESGNGVNRLASGYFGKVPGMPDNRYAKGNHGQDRHLAFRNESRLPVWRTGDDTDYEGDDRLEYEIVYDNLHCARQTNETASRYSSRGCVVVAGKPGDSGADRITSEIGPWKRFLQNAYGLSQRRFTLAIFEENEALRTTEVGIGGRSPTVRFGSRGILVERLQSGLVAKGYDIGSGQADGLFGGGTAQGLRQFQFAIFGKDGTDIIAGPGTAEALGIEWPANGNELAGLLRPSPPPDPPGEDGDQVSIHAPNEPVAAGALTSNSKLKIEIDVGHKPLPNWQIKKQPGAERWNVTIDGIADPVFLGRFREYNGYSDGPTRGLARGAGDAPSLKYKPTDWTSLGTWPELIFPTAWAESNACFTVINAWDRAAMTFGFIQLAAHTGDDFLPFFRRLFVELRAEARQWYPELDVVDGRLCFVKGGEYRSLENAVPPYDGGYTASYYHGDLMGFFNPDRYHKTNSKPDPEELHSAGRWLAWTLVSAPMRELQVKASTDKRSSLMRLHQRMLATPKVKQKYPGGVDGMRCDLLSVAIAVPHVSEAKIPVVLDALLTSDPIESIRNSDYGPGDRAQNVHDGMKQRPILRDLVYDLGSQKPV